MKKLFASFCLLMVLSAGAVAGKGGFKVVDLYLQPSAVLPLGDMYTYYGDGPGAMLRMVTSLSKRQSIVRLSLVANTGYYRFNGKSWYDTYNQEHRSDDITAMPLLVGMRAEIGNTKEAPFGMYVSQDLGATYISGPTNAVRFGHSINFGFNIGRIDLAMGFQTFRRSTGGNFNFFVFGIGYMIF